MIPKTIHYCWFGRNPKPGLAKKCMRSWKKYCKGYEIIEWNEDNFDLSTAPLYVRQAYEAKKWAFVSDWVRLKVVYDHGGIYLDTDVEIIKSLDSLLEYDAYFGFEDGRFVATGLGFGAKKSHPLLQELMADYDHSPFILSDGSFDTTTCPSRNLPIFLKHGLLQDNSKQTLDDGTVILPSDYLSPLDYITNELKRTKNTLSIHWFSASWHSTEEKKAHKRYKKNRKAQNRREKLNNCIHNIAHFPNRLLMLILKEERYDALKKKLKARRSR